MGVGRAVQRWGRARVLAWPLLTAKDLAPSTESSRLGHHRRAARCCGRGSLLQRGVKGAVCYAEALFVTRHFREPPLLIKAFLNGPKRTSYTTYTLALNVETLRLTNGGPMGTFRLKPYAHTHTQPFAHAASCCCSRRS